ncbi:MAG TPA: hypothetical protein VK659_16160, partial [Asanoa sp.]|nr:hypothetical protein [Asanoa sp.]
KHIGEGLDARHAAAIGNLIWTTLRGLVVAQLVVPDPLDTGRERRALIDMIAVYVESANVMLLRSPDGAWARGPGAAAGVEASGGVAGSRWSPGFVS